jgi:hypothetical protein
MAKQSATESGSAQEVTVVTLTGEQHEALFVAALAQAQQSMAVAQGNLLALQAWSTDSRERAIHMADARDAIETLRGDFDALDALGWPTR